MTNLNNLTIEQFAYTDKKSVLEAKNLLDNIIKNNNQKFVDSVRANNLPDLEQSYQWGLNWNQNAKNLALKLNTAIQYTDLQPNILNFLMNIIPDQQPDARDDRYNFPLKKDNTPKENWDLFFFKAVKESVFNYGNFKLNASLWLINKNPELFNNKSDTNEFMNRFCKTDLKDPLYEPIHNFLLTNHYEKLDKIFDISMSVDNFEFLKSHKSYSKIFEKNIETIVDAKDKMMVNAFKKANLQIIKYWHEQGIEFPNTKEPYSYLFASKKPENIEAIEYVCTHTKDITILNQIMLKTALHYDSTEVVGLILNSYTYEQIPQLEIAINGRPVNESIKKIKTFIDYHLLQNKILLKEEGSLKFKM